LIIHCASQPSHDLAKDRPFDDFEVNALGTLNLLESARQFCLESPFILMSTNKVYGDAPNERPLKELETRWDYADVADFHGIDEECRIDRTLHSLFGASKAAADLLVQEYGRYFGMPTVCLRAGCVTGPNHASAELHGFLAYLARCVKEGRTYRIYGYGGKQVRDNIHCSDLVACFMQFMRAPRAAAVYNIGGGRPSNCSMLEAIEACERISGNELNWTLSDDNRIGDHRWWISDLAGFRADYPGWDLRYGIEAILEEMIEQNAERWLAGV
jgi:CDP-paratose 2-epimerase